MSEIWTDMAPGDVIPFTKTQAYVPLTSFKKYVRHNGLDWECDYWTDPPCRSEYETVKKIWIVRTDTVDAERLLRIKERYSNKRSTGGESYFQIDSKKIPFAEGRVPRTTAYGWELMQIGDKQVVTMSRQNLYNRLVDAVRFRKLDWCFECQRMPELEREAGSKTPMWRVKRTR